MKFGVLGVAAVVPGFINLFFPNSDPFCVTILLLPALTSESRQRSGQTRDCISLSANI